MADAELERRAPTTARVLLLSALGGFFEQCGDPASLQTGETGASRMVFTGSVGLKGRAIVFAVLLLLGTGGAVCAALMWRHFSSSIEAVERNAVMNAHFIGLSAEPYVLLNDVQSLDHLVQAATTSNCVELTQILDNSGKVLAESAAEPRFVLDTQVRVVEAFRGAPTRDSFRVFRTTRQCLALVPIWPVGQQLDLGLAEEDAKESRDSGPIGFVLLAYTLDDVYRVLAKDAFSSLAITAALIGFGLAVTVVMVRQLLTPIAGLVQTASAIAEGDLSDRASEDAPGEVGVLARAFNNMADKVEDYAQNLEKLVYDRTVALERNEARTRAILDTAADGIITIDERGVVESFNAAAERVFGWTAAEVVGQNVSMLMPSPYTESHDSFINAYVRSGDPKLIGRGREVQGRRKDGSTFPMDLAVSEAGVGDRRTFTGIVRDITERKRAEEEQQKLVSLVENSSDLIMMCSLDGKVLHLNKSGRATAGLDAPEQVAGTTIADYMPSEEWARVREVELPMVLKSGSAEWHGELRHFKTGARISMQISFFLIRHPQTGEAMCFGSIQRDITAQKLAERQLKKNMAELEQFNRLAVGRELRMIELKRQVNEIARAAGLDEPYDLAFVASTRR
ncbi:MAG: PAS domain S-box protein [Planctomycetes bacterium]|nr:PAS domain S-box protein [Planctomycetota bacterium]